MLKKKSLNETPGGFGNNEKMGCQPGPEVSEGANLREEKPANGKSMLVLAVSLKGQEQGGCRRDCAPL